MGGLSAALCVLLRLKVTVLEAAPQLLPREDRAASEVLRGALERELTFHYGAAVTGIAYEPPFLGEEVPSSSESRTKAPWGTYKVSVTLQVRHAGGSPAKLHVSLFKRD